MKRRRRPAEPVSGAPRFQWDDFDYARRIMLASFRALAESGANPKLLESEIAGTAGVMRGLAGLIAETEPTSHG